MEKEELFISYKKYDWLSFRTTDIIGQVAANVNDYNTARVSVLNGARKIANCCVDYGLYEFARAMAVLEIAGSGRTAYRAWSLSCEIAFNTGDIEFCREFAIRNAGEGNSEKRYNPIKRESADQNAADIMGMIIDEIGELGELEGDDYEDLLEDL